MNVFGGGLALYSGGLVIGAVGVSGDTACADHMIGWRVRTNLGLDQFGTTTVGISGDANRPDNIVYDIAVNPTGGTGISAGGFGHPECISTGSQVQLPPVQ